MCLPSHPLKGGIEVWGRGGDLGGGTLKEDRIWIFWEKILSFKSICTQHFKCFICEESNVLSEKVVSVLLNGRKF